MGVEPCAPSVPPWIAVGAYAEYRFDSASVTFLNNTFVSFQDGVSATYRWECVELNGTMAKQRVLLEFGEEGSSVNLSNESYVDIVNRNVILPNGTLVGKTRLWVPPNLEEDETAVLWDNPPDQLVGRVINVEGAWSNTPQGAQRSLMLEGDGKILGQSIFVTLLYDVDTGVMIEGSLDYEATLLTLGVVNPGRSGLMQFVDTNINLGPREMWPEMMNLLVTATPLVLLVTSFVLVFRSRRKRAKRSGRVSRRALFF